MKALSFVFLPEPSLCEGKEFKELRTFNVQYATMFGPMDEIFAIIAMNCYTRTRIIEMINELSAKYLSMPPTEANVNAATIMTWNSRVLAKGPHDHVPAAPLVDIIHNRCKYTTDVSDMVYVPSQNGNWNMFKTDIRSRMHG